MKVVNIMLAKGLGGIEHSFLAYTRCLLELGYEAHVIIQAQAEIHPEILKLAVPIYSLPSCSSLNPFVRIKLAKILNTINPDIILIHGNRPLQLIRKENLVKKIIPIIHNYSFKRALSFKYLITTTQDLKKHILQKSLLSNKVFIIPNMLEVPIQAPIKAELSKPIVIGALGRFVKKKGFEVFIDSIALLQQWGYSVKGLIAGDGEEASFLKQYVDLRNLNEAISFLGWVKQEEFFPQLDLFCLPSRHEPFGMVLIEAFANQIPVVSTKTEGPLEIAVDAETALFVEIDDAEGMALALKKLIDDKALAQSLVKNAYQEVVQRYSITAVSHELAKVLEDFSQSK